MINRGQRTVFTRLIGMQLVSVCISLLIIGLLFGYLLQKYYFGVREWELIDQGNRMVRLVQEDIVDDDVSRARQRIYTIAESTDIDLWILDDQGEIVAGSQLAKEDTTLTLDQGETGHVLAGNNITKKVMGPKYQNLLVVLPLFSNNDPELSEVVGALAMRAPLGDIGATFNSVMRLIFIAALVAGFAVFIISIPMAKGFARPLEKLKQGTFDIAHGKFRQINIPAHSNEVDHLVAAFNYASEQMKKTSLEQQKLNKLRTEFIASLSHELRAPLTSLKGFLELMESPMPTEQREKYRRIMFKDALYLEHLVEDVQYLTKVESGQFELQRDWVNIVELIENTIERLQVQFNEKKVKINLDYQEELPLVYLDFHRCHQVFANIVLNALQYSSEYGQIDVSIFSANDFVTVKIQDYGPGISEEHLPYIWEKFYKIDSARTRSRQGSGLGLAIVKQIVEAHGGTVDAESVEGEGTTFLINLPITYS